MGIPEPVRCRPAAFTLFTEQMPFLETTDGLMSAAVAIAMHEMQRVRPAEIYQRIDDLADDVRHRARSAQPRALLAHLHDVLFDTHGFTGNFENYYDPFNSYLPAVLDTRRGIPITLCMVYKCVAQRVGLEVEGVNAPGHFLARVRLPGEHQAMIIDPFHAGRSLTHQEAFERIEQATQTPVPHEHVLLRAANHRQWLIRMLQNLIHIFAPLGREDDVAAMLEMRQLAQQAP